MKANAGETEAQDADKPRKYVYIPFIKKECSAKFLERINQFRSQEANQQYEFLVHGKCDLSSLPPQSRLYIPGFGINLKNAAIDSALLCDLPVDDHPYAISGGARAVSIETVALRMQKDGMLESHDLVIKLFFSDVHNQAQKLAKKLQACLVEGNPKCTFTIQYYPDAHLYPPGTQKGKEHKWAVPNGTEVMMRAKEARAFLFFEPVSQEPVQENVVVGLFRNAFSRW